MENIKENMNTDTVSREEYDRLRQRYDDLIVQYNWVLEQLKTSNKTLYGSKSAKASEEIVGQMMILFDEPETYVYLEEIKEKEKRTSVAGYERVRKEKEYIMDHLPENIPVETVDHTLSEDERTCPTCGELMTEIGTETRKTLVIVPAQFVVREDIYHKYSCKNCLKESGETEVLEVKREPTVYPGSCASEEAIAYLMTEKYVMGSPLYRMESDCKRKGIPLSRQTMSNWVIYAAEKWLKPIYDLEHQLLLNEPIINADETEVQVLHEKDRRPQSKSYMWMYRTGKFAEHPIVLFEYCPTRAATNPQKFLKGYKGQYLQTDGYSGYNIIKNVTHVGCLFHLKKKFHEAVEVLPKGKRTGAAVDGEAYCCKLFDIEKQLADLSPEERYLKRQELEKPIFDEFLVWGKNKSASNKSKLGVALTYLNNQGPYIANYLLDGRLESSNNLSERSIKGFIVNRKNFLFSNTPRGATASAITYSMIVTAIDNGLDPFKYLTYIFKTAPKIYTDENTDWVEKLLPQNVPDECKSANYHISAG